MMKPSPAKFMGILTKKRSPKRGLFPLKSWTGPWNIGESWRGWSSGDLRRILGLTDLDLTDLDLPGPWPAPTVELTDLDLPGPWPAPTVELTDLDLPRPWPAPTVELTDLDLPGPWPAPTVELTDLNLPGPWLAAMVDRDIQELPRIPKSSAHNLNVRGYGPTLIRMSDGDADARDHRL
eukprot:jgi/Botrbrau1/6578/Bobra.0189s0005.1